MSKTKSFWAGDERPLSDSVISLMKEYGIKLSKASDDLEVLRKEIFSAKAKRIEELQESQPPANQQLWLERFNAFQFLYNQKYNRLRRLIPAVIKLCQFVSQKIQHERLAELDKMELTLRLSELESIVSGSQDMLQVQTPNLSS